MKTLQVLLTTFSLLITAILFSQSDSLTNTKFEIHEIGITVDALDELKTIDWDDLFAVFEMDERNSKITFFVELKDVDVKNRSDIEVHLSNLKFSVSGYENQRDELQEQLSSIVKKLLKKYRS